jgi:Helix-turn-helix of DDE superfamily endonuclease
MSISYKDVSNERQWKATTGLSKEDFVLLRSAFAKAYEMLYEVGLQQGAENLKQEVVLSNYEECLYFVLFQLKNGLTNDCLGVIFGMDGSSAYRNFQKYLLVLELALHQQHALPRRSFCSVEEFQKYLKGEKEITCDVTEYPIQRPANKEKQKGSYSGKKKPYR